MIGEQIGQYKIVEAIGQGGMATVYKAYQTAFDRYVAIKVLSRQFSDDPTFVKRFQREARVVARIEHKSIVPMYDYGEENGLYYIVMRLIEGGTLRKKMFYDKVDLATAARITQQVAEALDYAHQHDVIHRDLKPGNILLDERGNAYLTDFGIAKMLGSNTQVTQSGVVGTPSYMSPEQCQGKTLGPASDIYSLGAILFEVLTGRVPYEADTPLSVMYMHVRDPIPSARALNPRLPGAIDRVFMRVLAKQPNARYPTAVAMVEDFREVAGIPEEIRIKPLERRLLLGGLFKRAATPAASAPPVKASIPQAVVSEEPTTPRRSGVSDDDQAAPYEEGYSEPAPQRPARADRQAFVAGAVGVIVVLGLLGAGVVGWTSLGRRGPSALVPTLPPQITPTEGDIPTQTAVYVVVTSEGPTSTPFSGGIIEPSATPTNSPLVVAVTPTDSPVPTATSNPPTQTSIPPTNTAPPPTNTAAPASTPGRIAYTEGVNNTAEIVVMNANGQNRQQLTSDSQYEAEPDWSPDGSRIAYEATVGADTDVYTMSANGGDIHRVTSTNQPNRHPDWSPNGTLITYESGKDEASEIYVIHPDGSGSTRLTNNGFSDRAPKFSPDGTEIAYMTDQRNKWEIAILAYPAGTQIALFDCPAPNCRFPDWSPDGTKLVYNTQDVQGIAAGISLLDVASGQTSVLLQGAQQGRPVWSGDGSAIFYNDLTDIYRFTVASGSITRLTSAPNQAYGPDWGP